jgi:hypothetical protein
MGHGSSDRAPAKKQTKPTKQKPEGRYQWERGRHKERAKEGEDDGCSLYSCMKID